MRPHHLVPHAKTRPTYPNSTHIPFPTTAWGSPAASCRPRPCRTPPRPCTPCATSASGSGSAPPAVPWGSGVPSPWLRRRRTSRTSRPSRSLPSHRNRTARPAVVRPRHACPGGERGRYVIFDFRDCTTQEGRRREAKRERFSVVLTTKERVKKG